LESLSVTGPSLESPQKSPKISGIRVLPLNHHQALRGNVLKENSGVFLKVTPKGALTECQNRKIPARNLLESPSAHGKESIRAIKVSSLTV